MLVGVSITLAFARRVEEGTVKRDSQVINTRAHSKERIGQLIEFHGKETSHVDAFGPGDIGAVAKVDEIHFDAVLHYDLAWNPTRHEQREGRVDRFGQKETVVRVVTYYGADNPIDGVILRRAVDLSPLAPLSRVIRHASA